MSSARHRLDKLLKKAKRLCTIDASACRNIVATTREMLEAQALQSDFTVTNLYCNWSLHSQITGSITAVRTLEAVSNQFIEALRGRSSANTLLQFLSQDVFRIDPLRQELLSICKGNDLNDSLFTIQSNWEIFSALLLQDLVGKPIQFPDGADEPLGVKDSQVLVKTKKIYRQLLASMPAGRVSIFRKAWVSLDFDPWDERPEKLQTPSFHCNIEGYNEITYRIRIWNVEPLREADDYQLQI